MADFKIDSELISEQTKQLSHAANEISFFMDQISIGDNSMEAFKKEVELFDKMKTLMREYKFLVDANIIAIDNYVNDTLEDDEELSQNINMIPQDS